LHAGNLEDPAEADRARRARDLLQYRCDIRSFFHMVSPRAILKDASLKMDGHTRHARVDRKPDRHDRTLRPLAGQAELTPRPDRAAATTALTTKNGIQLRI